MVADASPPAPVPRVMYAKMIFVTLLQTYPFLALVQSFTALEPDEYLQCTSQKPCTYIRLIGSADVPATNFRFQEVKNEDHDVERCDQQEMRQKIRNSLPASVSVNIYVSCVIAWAGLKMLHDGLVLAASKESVSLLLGKISMHFQHFAAGAGFMSAMGAVEVFVARDERTSLHCWYELPDLQALLSFATPGYLLYLGLMKQRAVTLAMINGDYLYYQQFDIPFHVVRHSRGMQDGTLLLPLVVGSAAYTKREPAAPQAEFYASVLKFQWITIIMTGIGVVPVVISCVAIVPRALNMVLDELATPEGHYLLTRVPLRCLTLLPCLLAVVDSIVRVRHVVTEHVPFDLKLGILVCTLCDVYAAFNLTPPRSVLLGTGPLTRPSLAHKTAQGWSACFVMFMFLLVRYGISQMLMKNEERELLVFLKAGFHINMVARGAHTNARTRLRGVGLWLDSPRQILEYAEQHKEFASLYLESEVQLATKFLLDMPGYDHTQDWVKWQESLYEDWTSRDCQQQRQQQQGYELVLCPVHG